MGTKTQAEIAYEGLKRRILSLTAQPRQRLKEEEWANNFSVSRAAIRESLTRLLGEGLVYAGERGGFFVAEMTADDVAQLRELREIIETSAFRLACERATQDEIDAIAATCDDHASMVHRGYLAGSSEADLAFHQQIVAASHNARLLRAYNSSNIPLFHMKLGRASFSSELITYTAADHAETEREHRAIVEALAARDEEKGIAVLMNHFRRGEALVVGD
ncbi:MAG: GntR family transcriptional regulator [Planctomycetota bacterium]|nr:GntR family transcriptional regulator [Planctomycetota bacterium]